jgi:hypothetical protein
MLRKRFQIALQKAVNYIVKGIELQYESRELKPRPETPRKQDEAW